MTDLQKIEKLFLDAFNSGVKSVQHQWDIDQMRQVTKTTMMRELMEIMKGAYPAMMFDGDGDMVSTVPIADMWL